MGDAPHRLRLLRYAPNAVSGEFYNVGLVVYDAVGRPVDARFAPDFRRLRCNPLVEMKYLESLRAEFEEARLAGEGFAAYLGRFEGELSGALRLDEAPAIELPADPMAEIDRLVEVYLATGSGLSEAAERLETASLGRRAVRARMDDAFRRAGLFRNGRGLRRQAAVRYGERPGGAPLEFVFDFAYRTAAERYLHALGSRGAAAEAGRLCLVFERIRGPAASGLIVVGPDELDPEARDLLASSEIETVGVGALEPLAERIRAELDA